MEEFINHLREEHRVKLMCDYSYVLKYGVLSMLAPVVWLTVLREHEALLPGGLTIQWVELPNTGYQEETVVKCLTCGAAVTAWQ